MMTMVPVRAGFHYVAPLPADGQWRTHSAFEGQCALVADISGRHMPRLIIDGRVVTLIGVDQQTYLEFLIDTHSRNGRIH